MSDKLILYFEGYETIELTRVQFTAQDSNTPNISIRGKTSGAFVECGSFQWTSAVRAVTVVAIRYAIRDRTGSFNCCLVGGRGSLAASLDYALSKSPVWLSDMFGRTSAGMLYARRLFRITNPNRKRPGPVAVAINPLRLSGAALAIYLNGKLVTEPGTLYTMLVAIEGPSVSLEPSETVPANDPTEPKLKTGNS